ncbi:hypothetical protein BC941DRAFT_443045 [Chlamydoabsidia padenii]|nr:hypothetical protein BC941DRAFT_443045 [Chlamydoabsidia padenii]
MSSWCSWLSRLSNTQTVCGSNPHEDIFCFQSPSTGVGITFPFLVVQVQYGCGYIWYEYRQQE